MRRESLTALRMLATALSAALVQRELLQRLEHLSMSDALTGLGNRRAFDEALEAEMARARRASGSMGLVILDVDHFKQFNDRHGHQAGDDALVTVARVLAGEARAEDRACRIGGEEFALLLPGADDATAATVAERVRRRIQTRVEIPDFTRRRDEIGRGIGEGTVQIEDHRAHAAENPCKVSIVTCRKDD